MNQDEGRAGLVAGAEVLWGRRKSPENKGLLVGAPRLEPATLSLGGVCPVAAAEGQIWRSIGAALDVPVSSVRGYYLAFLFLGLLGSAGRFLGTTPAQRRTEKFREGVEDFCPSREVTSAGSRVFRQLTWPRLYGSSSRERRWFWPTASCYECEGDLSPGMPFASASRRLVDSPSGRRSTQNVSRRLTTLLQARSAVR